MAWRCRLLTARRSQRGHAIAENGLSEELSVAPDTLVDFHTGEYASATAAVRPLAATDSVARAAWWKAPSLLCKFSSRATSPMT